MKEDLTTVKTYIEQVNIISDQYMDNNVTKINIFGYMGGPGEVLDNKTGPILLPIYPLTDINVLVKYGINLIRTILVKIQNMKNN